MKIKFVRDVIRKAEDCDHIRIRTLCGNMARVIASGEWYCDCILDKGDKVVKSYSYDESCAVWDILI